MGPETYKHQIRMKSLEGETIRVFGDVPRDLKHPASLPWNEFLALWKPVVDWCKENCSGKFKAYPWDDGWHTDSIYIGYVFNFELESDIVAFKIRWR